MKKAISGHSLIVAAREQVSSDPGEGVAILDLGFRVYCGVSCGLDAVRAYIRHLAQEPRAVNEVRDALLEESLLEESLLEECDVEPERCERDPAALRQRLAAEGLVEEVKSATPA